MSCGNCDCCPKCGCKATCTCENSFSEAGSPGMSFTVAGETGKCGNCSCPAGTCAKGNNESMTVSGSDDTGKCGNCNCPPGTCANNKD
ncbi:unnamed protein product [Sphagnum troendelagicum]|uniref:Metallothionein n=1 Tax=Sphagnum troendelagicum TaxID=128251 RepID=A0ABP0UAI4_9BRYO